MATYQQYSEIVAAYGTRLPPPSSQAERPRLGLPLLYAAVGVALGTLTGMAAALVSLQPQTAMAATHLSFVSSHASAFRIHPITNAGQTPVIQNHAAAPTASVAQPAAVQNHDALQAVPATHPQVLEPRPVMPAAVQNHNALQLAPAVQPQVLEAKSVTPATPLAKPSRMETAAVPPAATLKIAAAEPVRIKAPAVHAHVLTGKLTLAPASDLGADASAPNLNSLGTSATASIPAPVDAPLNLDGGTKPQVQVFYSEGDISVADYNATRDTIETEDGRTFVIGPTVSVSTATSWDDYRANVHYRCDQNGNCSLSRTGVIALNARMI
jgi:hypothetical protein